MSLLEEWEAGINYHDTAQNATVDDDGLGLLPEALPPAPSVDRPIFALQVAERQLSRYAMECQRVSAERCCVKVPAALAEGKVKHLP